MAVAVVFLPLLGAVIAGFFGRAIGDRGAQFVTCGAVCLSAALAIPLFLQILAAPAAQVAEIAPWISAGGVHVDWALRLDRLSGVMLVTVTIVSAAVHIYSIGYMAEDPSIPRFMAYLNWFVFFMLMLVTADNFVQLFFGWEGVGLLSYLLIAQFRYRVRGGAAPRQHGDRLSRLAGAGADLGLYSAVYRRDGQIGAARPAYLAARRDGRTDAGLGADPRRDDGDGRRLHGGAPVAAVRARPRRARRGRRDRRHHRDVRRQHRHCPARHQAGHRLFAP